MQATYKNHVINKVKNGYRVEAIGISYKTIGLATNAVDRLAK